MVHPRGDERIVLVVEQARPCRRVTSAVAWAPFQSIRIKGVTNNSVTAMSGQRYAVAQQFRYEPPHQHQAQPYFRLRNGELTSEASRQIESVATEKIHLLP